MVLAANGMVALDDSRARDLDRDRIWPERVAARKGHSYFLFSLIFFPAALIVAHLVADRTATAY